MGMSAWEIKKAKEEVKKIKKLCILTGEMRKSSFFDGNPAGSVVS